MIQRMIEFSLKNRGLVLLAYLVLAAWGYWALLRTPIDAIPDLSENQVIVFTDWAGRSPQEVEDQITYPLTVNLQGLAGIKTVRSSSAFGFSMVNLIFEDNVDLYFARTRVLEKLNLSSGILPEGVTPVLGPDATGVGQVYWYTVDGPYDPGTLHSLQHWFIRYQLNSVPGVAEVGTVGGFLREYQVDVDPVKLRAYNVPLRMVFESIQRSNTNVGAKVVEVNDTEMAVRGIGLIGSIADIENIVLTAGGGTPVYLRNVATVHLGPDFRRGVLDRDGKEAVGGVIVIRSGENALQVIDAVKRKIKDLEPGLPPGVHITSFYDRSSLIHHAVDTLKHALIEEILLVTLAHVIFLWHFRSILIVTLPLPLAVSAAFLFMHYFGISSNIMSLGGIAIAIGVLVDAGIVVTENVIRHAEAYSEEHGEYRSKIIQITLEATRVVGRPIFFAMTIIILAFVPVFALTGMEGKLFHPLAFTKTFAMVGSTLIAVTLVPVLCTFLIRGKLHREEANPVMHFLQRLYKPVLAWALRHRIFTMAGAVALFLLAMALATTIGTEFMPPLDEETVMFMPITDPAISLTKATEILREQDRIIAQDQAVENVVGKIGRADTSTDPAPINMTETIITLKPRDQWSSGTAKEDILQRLDAKLRMPGVTNIWTQPIRNRIDMLSTGIRTQVGIKIFGSDLSTIESLSNEIEQTVHNVSGAVDLYAERITGSPYLEIKTDRVTAARYGIGVGDVQDVIETAVGGKNLTTAIDGRQRLPISLRYARDFRETPEALGSVLVAAPNGAQIPLAQLASIHVVMGPAMISSENGLLRGSVLMNVRGRDVVSFVTEAQRAVARQVRLPTGYYIEWSGQYENQLSARRRLMLVIPAVFAIMSILLYKIYDSLKEALHVMLAVPFALTGGIFLLKILGYNFSVAVWVGFIALFGTAVQTGVVMVIYLEEAVARKKQATGTLTVQGLHEAVMEGALLRLRPKVMTVSTVIAGLLPLMWSARTGAEVMKPLATPVLGGMVSSLLHVLIVTPVIFTWLREREIRRG
ncbi:MAG TPA: CusA/CzcA family heavy metal efflux RND transporter [Candidatus Sulfotelmatobacter sp.]|nr:CusA/CzcA family heavy metal efflux RND transporter [Candidatus Sulfotelmatobacter sp.]